MIKHIVKNIVGWDDVYHYATVLIGVCGMSLPIAFLCSPPSKGDVSLPAMLAMLFLLSPSLILLLSFLAYFGSRWIDSYVAYLTLGEIKTNMHSWVYIHTKYDDTIYPIDFTLIASYTIFFSAISLGIGLMIYFPLFCLSIGFFLGASYLTRRAFAFNKEFRNHTDDPNAHSDK